MARKAVVPKANGGETLKGGKVGKKNPSRNAKKKEDSPVDRFSQDDTSEKEDTSSETVEASKSAASTKNSKSSKNEKKPVIGRGGKHDSKTVEDEDAPDVVEPPTERNGILKRDGINVSKTHKEVLPSIAAVINDLIENEPNTPLDIIAFMNMVTGKLNQQFPVGTEF